MRNTWRVTLVALALSLAALAHGKAERFFGTVIEVSAKRLVIRTTANETKEFAVQSSTRFIRSGKAATAKDLTSGERVIVEADVHSKDAVAEVVKFGKPQKPGANH